VNYAQKFTHDQSPLGTRSRVGLSLDARSNTEYGLLRTFVAPKIDFRTGSDNSGSANAVGYNLGGNNLNAGGINGLGIGAQGKQMQTNFVGYIQFGGLTVGHMESFFSSAMAPQTNIGLDGRDQRDEVSTIAYTASLGNGLSIIGALEDGTITNRNGIFDNRYIGAYGPGTTLATNTPGAAAGTTAVTPGGVINQGTGGTGYGSNRLPDYVLSGVLDQAWGKLQLSGMIHSINTNDGEISSLDYLYSATKGASLSKQYLGGTNQSSLGTQYGYALQAQTKINLPMIANGDYLYASVVYSVAANAMSLRNSGGADRTNQNYNGMGIGRVATSVNDLVIDTTGGVHKPTVWGTSAEFNHQFTPTLGVFLGGSYTAISWDAVAQAENSKKINPANLMIANLGIVWTPVKGFKITPDFEYAKITTKVANANGWGSSTANATADLGAKKSESALIGRIKIQRDF